MKRLEQELHKTIAEYLDKLAPVNEFWWCHVPNGGARSKIEASILKGLGVKPGVADILIIKAGRAYWIELKSPRGSQSDTQHSFELQMYRCGCPYVVVRSLDMAIGTLRGWGMTKARTT